MENQLYSKLNQLLNEEKFETARELIEDTFKTISFTEFKESLFLKVELFGFLIDIGCESQNEKDLLDAIEFLESNEEQLLPHITKASYYYNLANAKHGLGRIFWSNNRGVHPINIVRDKFQEPIKLYWLAFKNITDEEKGLLQKIMINLSNCLVDGSRLIESLQFLNMVLKVNPTFSQALISKADNLLYLTEITNCSVTASLYTRIYSCYDQGIKTNIIPPSILNRCMLNREQALSTIQALGFNECDIEDEIKKSEDEFNRHSEFRKYCIINFLTLNEHSIYCNCISTKEDDLQIGVKHGMFKGDIVPKLELLLNRIKSEFALSRWLYFQSLHADSEIEYNAMFSELFDGEIINSSTEMQRTSFRLCYGVLDKIALGICKLYNLNNKRIHFETFWDEPKRNKELNKIRNIHLNALYSIACDLNTNTGELKQFKNWRNKLEHNLLILKDTSVSDFDILKLFSDEDFVAVVDGEEFKRKTLHLLQLTRAAIFSYVYCVRLQTIQHKVKALEKRSLVIDFKK
jgi:hypothetical protein